MPPPYLARRFAVLKAFGKFEFEMTARLHGAKIPEQRKPSKQG